MRCRDRARALSRNSHPPPSEGGGIILEGDHVMPLPGGKPFPPVAALDDGTGHARGNRSPYS
ncbi:hypothetical protein CFP59_00450 [Streptomyces malaysiensis subsp. malaysiensis]|nr:hypothetical protein CFP59_00450 [Streptomyces sp. M56]